MINNRFSPEDSEMTLRGHHISDLADYIALERKRKLFQRSFSICSAVF